MLTTELTSSTLSGPFIIFELFYGLLLLFIYAVLFRNSSYLLLGLYKLGYFEVEKVPGNELSSF